MAYKTLIIIDNSNELTSLNKEIIKLTLKYYINHMGKDEKVAIAVTGQTAEYLTDYDDSKTTQIKTIEDLKYTDANAPGADVLMEVIMDWKDDDLAHRDILYVSARSAFIESEYTEEEVFFEINGKEYPIYTLACAQNENEGLIKNLSSLSRISGGKCISTDDAKEEAGVEQQLCEMIFKAMEVRRGTIMSEEEKSQTTDPNLQTGDYKSDEEATDSDSMDITDLEDAVSTKRKTDIEEDETETDLLSDEDSYESGNAYSENVIYEMPVVENTTLNRSKFIYPIIAIIFVVIILIIVMKIKSNSERKREERFKSNLRKRADSKVRNPFDEESADTVCLNTGDDEDSSGTRLLYQTKEGIEITLEDRANPTKYYRVCVRDSIVIGRNEKLCDVAITYDDSISSRHCELYTRDNSLYCRDLGSSNGTTINQQKVYQEIKIESGDILRLGRASFFVQIIGDRYE